MMSIFDIFKRNTLSDEEIINIVQEIKRTNPNMKPIELIKEVKKLGLGEVSIVITEDGTELQIKHY